MRFFCLLVALAGCKTTYVQSVNSALDSTLKKRGKSIFITAYEARNRLINQGRIDFISEKDTIYFLEDYDFPSETFYGAIWTKQKSFYYLYSNSVIEEKDETLFKKDILNLITPWDTTNITRESNLKFNRFNPNHFISAYRVYELGHKIKVDKILFRPF